MWTLQALQASNSASASKYLPCTKDHSHFIHPIDQKPKMHCPIKKHPKLHMNMKNRAPVQSHYQHAFRLESYDFTVLLLSSPQTVTHFEKCFSTNRTGCFLQWPLLNIGCRNCKEKLLHSRHSIPPGSNLLWKGFPNTALTGVHWTSPPFQLQRRRRRRNPVKGEP